MRRLSFFLTVGCFAPLSVAGQNWSPQEQGLLDHLSACWEAADVSQENWERVCRPTDDMVFWWGDEPAPAIGLDWWRDLNVDWHARFDRIAWDVRPAAIRFYGDVGVVYYAWIQVLRTADGELVNEQGSNVEVYVRTSGGWEYVAGMGAPSGSP